MFSFKAFLKNKNIEDKGCVALKEIEHLFDQEKYREIAKIYEGGSNFEGDATELLIEAYLHLEEYDKAILILNGIVQSENNKEFAIKKLAYAYRKQGAPLKSLEILHGYKGTEKNSWIHSEYIASKILINFEESKHLLLDDHINQLEPEGMFEVGLSLFSLGYYDHAKDIFLKAYHLKSEWRCENMLGACSLILNDFESAEHYLRKAYINKKDPSVSANLAQLYVCIGDLDRAKRILRETVSLGGKPWDLFVLLSSSYSLKKQYQEAKDILEECVDLGGETVNVYRGLANAYYNLGDYEEAEYFFRLLVHDTADIDNGSLTEDVINGKLDLADFLCKEGKAKEGRKIYRGVLSLDPNNYKALVNLGVSYFSQGYVLEAIELLSKCVELYPDSVEANNNLGVSLREAGRFDEAIYYLDRANSLHNVNQADEGSVSLSRDIAMNRAMINVDLGVDLEEAKLLFDKLIGSGEANPNVSWYRAITHLSRGEYQYGWLDYERRWSQEHIPERPYKLPLWAGQNFDGTLLVYAEQGIGDEIMFASCIQDLIKDVPKVILECSPKLEKIFKCSFPEVEVLGVDRSDDGSWISGNKDTTYQLPIGSLPKFYRNSSSDFTHESYIKVQPEAVKSWKKRIKSLGPGLNVGISWKGGTKKSRKILRSLELEDFVPILKVEGVNFINLQYKDYEVEIDQLKSAHGLVVHDFPEAIADYHETAALVGSLDLVISVQTAIVHLAGAMGKKVFCMLPFSPEWRYRMGGSRMVWYSDVSLIKQEASGEWADVIESVSEQLQLLLEQ